MLKAKKNYLPAFLFMLFYVTSAQAQWFPETLLTSPKLAEKDSNTLSFSVDFTGFFKNNEYFSPVAKGQTYPGISMIPALAYQVSGTFRAEAGLYAVKYSGREKLFPLQPFIRLQYAVTPDFNMVLGNLYGGLNHRLIEPLYQWERQWIAHPESGLQFVLDNDRWFVDTWIDWQHYIERGDPVPEVLTFGASVSKLLTAPGNKFSLTFPFQLLIHHHGGQIDTSDDPMIVLGNAATGLCSRIQTDHRRIRSIGLDIYVAAYHDRHPDEALRPFDKGWGIYPVLHVDATPFKLMAGYWHSDKFYAFQGERLFNSFDIYDPQKQFPKTDLITIKLAFEKEVYRGVSIGAQVETYTGLNRGGTDYSFGVHIRFDKRFRVKQF